MAFGSTNYQAERSRPKSSNNKRKVDGDAALQRRKRKKPNPFEGGVSRPKKHAVAPLKTRVRDLKRQLSRLENLPADIRVAKERELAACERELASEQADKERQGMIGKYHMVRFFDRRKAERRLNRARRALVQAESVEQKGVDGTVEKCREDVREKEIEVAYTHYYPLAIKYESLFPTGGGNDEEQDDDTSGKDKISRRGNEAIWNCIRIAMKKGQGALLNLRESDPETLSLGLNSVDLQSGRRAGKVELPGPQKRERTKAPKGAKISDDESDGGFFE